MVNLISAKYRRGEYAGQTIHLPVVGNVVFNKDGSVDVEEDKVDAVIEHTRESLMLRRKDPKKGSENDPIVKKQIKEDQIREQLASLSFVQLVDLAKEAGLDIHPASTDDKLRADLLKELLKEKEEAPEEVKTDPELKKAEKGSDPGVNGETINQ